MCRVRRGFLLLLLLGAGLEGAGLQAPQPGYLFWPNGPPNLDTSDGWGSNFPAPDTDQRFLAVLTENYYLELDVRECRINRFVLPGPGDRFRTGTDEELRAVPSPALPGQGRIILQSDSGQLEVTPAHSGNYTPDTFPVRVVESGPWFQHFTLHDLALAGNAPGDRRGEFWLDFMAWPGRVRIILRTADASLARSIDRLGQSRAAVAGITALTSFAPPGPQDLGGREVHSFAALEWAADGEVADGGDIASPDPRVSISHDAKEGISVVRLAPLQFDKKATTPLGTPARLGAGAVYPLRIANPSEKPSALDVKVELPDNVSLTGHSLLLCDEQGFQTGIPVQISKNWHAKDVDEFLPHMGSWSHGRVSLVLPPRYDSKLLLKLVQGDFGAYHAASIAQLSLVGWGGNGFWIEAALGSWGETVCLQPGRVLRRSFLTDWRPFKSTSIGGGTYDWTANDGGADLFVCFDGAGNYVPYAGNKHLIRSNGPCMARMDFSEISKDRRIETRGSWFLPMTKDVARLYLKVQCNFLKEVDFSRFSILQAGADQYNPTTSTSGALGNSEGLILEKSFSAGSLQSAFLAAPVVTEGDLPWITLFGNSPSRKARIGQSQRIIVIHDWNAVMDGKTVQSPHAAFYNSRAHRQDSFQAEIVPDPSITRFRAGDFIEMTLEFVLVPLDEDSYWGGDSRITALLRNQPNHWRMAHAIAVGNNPRLAVGDNRVVAGPLPVISFADLEERLVLTGTSSLVPLTVQGISAAGRLVALDEAQAQTVPPQQWGLNPDGTWDAVLIIDPARFPAGLKLGLDTSAGACIP